MVQADVGQADAPNLTRLLRRDVAGENQQQNQRHRDNGLFIHGNISSHHPRFSAK
jgi:hypothetical protein